MPRSRKIDLGRVQASLDKTCPKCGFSITPDLVKRVELFGTPLGGAMKSAERNPQLLGDRSPRGASAAHSVNSRLADKHPRSPEPSFAERARTLVYLARIGSLSTISRKQPGFPFGSVMPYGLDDHGRSIFLISTMAMHTHNLQADSRASLLVAQPDASDDPLGASRVTLMGNILPIPKPEVPEA